MSDEVEFEVSLNDEAKELLDEMLDILESECMKKYNNDKKLIHAAMQDAFNRIFSEAIKLFAQQIFNEKKTCSKH